MSSLCFSLCFDCLCHRKIIFISVLLVKHFCAWPWITQCAGNWSAQRTSVRIQPRLLRWWSSVIWMRVFTVSRFFGTKCAWADEENRASTPLLYSFLIQNMKAMCKVLAPCFGSVFFTIGGQTTHLFEFWIIFNFFYDLTHSCTVCGMTLPACLPPSPQSCCYFHCYFCI